MWNTQTAPSCHQARPAPFVKPSSTGRNQGGTASLFARPPYFRVLITRASFPTPLSASQRFPFLSMSMLRTVPPPLGIGHVRNFFVSGLKRTSTFFVSSPVSTYQTAPSDVTSIAYGLDSGPSADLNSSTLPVFGSR